jgi:hypothetical protein
MTQRVQGFCLVLVSIISTIGVLAAALAWAPTIASGRFGWWSVARGQ